jgi:hypothetical protein
MFITAIQQSIYLVIAVSDCDECGFNDLGKLLFGGVILAIIVGVAVSLLHRRMKDKSAHGSGFVSINSSQPKE